MVDVFLHVALFQRLPHLLVQLHNRQNDGTFAVFCHCRARGLPTSSSVTHCWDRWLRCIQTAFLRKTMRSFAKLSYTFGENESSRLISTCLSLCLLLFKQSLPHTCSSVPLSSPLELLLTCSRYAGRTCLPGKHSVQTYGMWVTLTSEWFWCHGCQHQRLKTHPDAVGAAISAVPASSAFCFACRAFV